MRSRNAIRGLILVCLGLLPLFAIFFVADPDEFFELLINFDGQDLSVMLTLSLLMYGARFLRWDLIVQQHHLQLTRSHSLQIFLSGLAMAFTPARAGEFFRAYFVPNLEARTRFAFHSFFMEKLGDMLSILIFSGTALYFSSLWEHPFFQNTPFTICWVLLAFTILFASLILVKITWQSKAAKSMRLKIRPLIAKLTMVYFVRLILLSMLVWAIQLCVVSYIVQKSSISIDFTDVIIVYTLSLLVGTVSLIPGGLGSFDVTYLLLMRFLDQGEENALVSLIAIRLFGVWLGVFLGLPAWQRSLKESYRK